MRKNATTSATPLRRLGLLAALVGLVVLVLALRLLDLQFRSRDRILALVERRWTETSVLPSLRGALRDREGVPLARDVAAFRVALAPSQWRERSVIEAVIDLEIFAGLADASDRRRHREDWREATRRPERIRALLAVEARRLATAPTRSTQEYDLLLRPVGDLVRRPPELSYRLRQALGRVLGDTVPLRAARLRALSADARPLGQALGLVPAHLEARIDDELAALARLALALGDQDLNALGRRLEDALDREWLWIEGRVAAELEKAARIAHLDVEAPSAEVIGREAWAEFARDVRAPFRRAPPHDRVTRATAGLAAAILAGRWPEPIAQTEHAPLTEWPDDVRQGETISTDAALLALSDAEISEARPEPVLERWYRDLTERPEFAREAAVLLSDRRRADLVAGLRGGRGFPMGQGRGALLAPLVWGLGGLQELGFELTPTFERDPILGPAQSQGLRLLLGTVARSTRAGIGGVEAMLDATLRGKDGASGREGLQGERETREPEHGQDLELALSSALCTDLEGVLQRAAPATPAALAIVDVQTGAILGLASWPLPRDIESVREERLALELEGRVIADVVERFAPDFELGAMRQRRLRLEEDGGAHARLELEVLARAERGGRPALRARVLELAEEKALHAGWHRAVENPGYSGPGSVFKALTLLAGLEYDRTLHDHTIVHCGPETRIRTRHSCKSHGDVDVRRALKVSCNEYCYVVGEKLGSEKLVEFYARVGLFDPIPGLLPAAPEWYIEGLTRANPKNLSIGGQGISCVPVRAAGIAASIARGERVVPWLVRERHALAPQREPITRDPAFLAAIHEGMRAVCEPGGTAGRVPGLERLRIAAKTGTSDYDVLLPSGEQASRNEAWFVGFAPAEAPRFAFAALISRTKLQGSAAAALCRDALELTAQRFGGPWW